VGAGQYAGHVQQVVRARNDRLIADRLTSFVAGLPTGW
jgi:hypothetical protein